MCMYSPSLSMYIDIWWPFYRVCLLVKVHMWAFWDFFFFIFTSSHLLLDSKMSDLLVGALGCYLFHHYIHYWCDFTPCLIWVDHHSSLYVHCFAIILATAFDSFLSLHHLILVLQWPIPGLLPSLHHFYTSHYHFNLLHLSLHQYYIHIGNPYVHGSRVFLYMLHFIHEGMGF